LGEQDGVERRKGPRRRERHALVRQLSKEISENTGEGERKRGASPPSRKEKDDEAKGERFGTRKCAGGGCPKRRGGNIDVVVLRGGKSEKGQKKKGKKFGELVVRVSPI